MTMVLFVSLLLAFCWQIPPLRVFIIVCVLFFLLCFLLTLTEKDKYTYKIKKDSNWSKIMEEYAKKRRRLEIYNEDYAFHRWQENQFSYYAPLYKEKMDNPPKTKVIVQLKDKSAPIYLSDEMTCNERLNELHLRYRGKDDVISVPLDKIKAVTVVSAGECFAISGGYMGLVERMCGGKATPDKLITKDKHFVWLFENLPSYQ